MPSRKQKRTTKISVLKQKRRAAHKRGDSGMVSHFDVKLYELAMKKNRGPVMTPDEVREERAKGNAVTNSGIPKM